jgi:hypothetical protein
MDLMQVEVETLLGVGKKLTPCMDLQIEAVVDNTLVELHQVGPHID